jgi:multidrug resistance efflux pump
MTQLLATAASTGTGPPGETAQPPTAAPPAATVYSPRTRRVAKRALVLLMAIMLVEATVLGVSYLTYGRQYVSTDNATVDCDQQDIAASASGYLLDWQLTPGSPLHRGRMVGLIRAIGVKPQTSKILRAPDDGTVAFEVAHQGEFVQAGDTLAVAYDTSKVYVTARVSERAIARVRPGQIVDVAVDAYPGSPVLGMVTDIQASTADKSTVYPSTDLAPPNIQKINQYVPVRVAIISNPGLVLAPGMNVSVRIHTG